MSREVVLARKPLYRVGKFQSIHPTIERNMVEILMKEINYSSRVESLKRELINCYYYSSTSTFRTIDLNNIGFITPMMLDSFFMRNNCPVTSQRVDAIVRRIDYEGDSRISFTELDEFLRPTSLDLAVSVKPILTAPILYTSPTLSKYSRYASTYRPYVSRYASPVRTTTRSFESPLG